MNAATLRLDLGLGGNSVEDSILFGTKVLSLSGALTKKNISEVENNVVCGNTSWKHQDAYVRMIIAGCMNQAERLGGRALWGEDPWGSESSWMVLYGTQINPDGARPNGEHILLPLFGVLV